MRIEPRAFGFAAGLTAALLFTLCAVAVALSPGSTTALAGFLVHADLSGLTRSLTLTSFIGGLALWAVGIGLTFALAGWLYNRLTSWFDAGAVR